MMPADSQWQPALGAVNTEPNTELPGTNVYDLNDYVIPGVKTPEAEEIDSGGPLDWIQENIVLGFWVRMAKDSLFIKEYALSQVLDYVNNKTVAVSAKENLVKDISDLTYKTNLNSNMKRDLLKIFAIITSDDRLAMETKSYALANKFAFYYALGFGKYEANDNGFRSSAVEVISNIVADPRQHSEGKEGFAIIFLRELKNNIDSPSQFPLDEKTKAATAVLLGRLYLDNKVSMSIKEEIAKYVEVSVIETAVKEGYGNSAKVRRKDFYIFQLLR